MHFERRDNQMIHLIDDVCTFLKFVSGKCTFVPFYKVAKSNGMQKGNNIWSDNPIETYQTKLNQTQRNQIKVKP